VTNLLLICTRGHHRKHANLSLNAINTRVEVEVNSHAFLIAGLDGSRRLISHSGRSTHGGNGSRNSKVRGWVEKNFSPALGKDKIFYRFWKSNNGFFFVERAVYTHTDRAIPAPLYEWFHLFKRKFDFFIRGILSYGLFQSRSF